MDFTSLKDILKKEKSKIILVEDGKPNYIIIPIEEYHKLLAASSSTGEKGLEDVNKQIEELNLEELNCKEELTLSELDLRETQEIKIEDLPF